MAEQQNEYIKSAVSKVESDAKYLWDSYPTAEALMSEALKGAMTWAPGFLTKGVPPSVQQMLTLAAQLVTVAAATNKGQQARKIGFTS